MEAEIRTLMRDNNFGPDERDEWERFLDLLRAAQTLPARPSPLFWPTSRQESDDWIQGLGVKEDAIQYCRFSDPAEANAQFKRDKLPGKMFYL
jgi:hypothetical protein